LRINTILSGDDDDIATFNDTQHRATMNLAQIAIQSTLNDLVSDRIIPYEEADGTITYVSGTRLYALPSNFVRFKDENPFLLELDGSSNSANQVVTLANENVLRRQYLDYRSQSGSPDEFYLVNGTTKRIGLFPVPDSSGTVARFPYEKDVSVTNSTDALPFSSTIEANAFVDMAARYFQFLFTKAPLEGLENDIIYRKAKSALMQFLKGVESNSSYGYSYR